MRLLLLPLLLIAGFSFGQAPEAFKYQAVVRNAGGNIIANQSVGYRLRIIQGTPSGTTVYTETFSVTSNNYGIVNLEIGTGTTVDNFSIIDWGNGPFFIETSADLSGGTNYSLMGTSELVSVPYALHSKTAETLIGGISSGGPQFIQPISLFAYQNMYNVNWVNETFSIDIDTVLNTHVNSVILYYENICNSGSSMEPTKFKVDVVTNGISFEMCENGADNYGSEYQYASGSGQVILPLNSTNGIMQFTVELIRTNAKVHIIGYF